MRFLDKLSIQSKLLLMLLLVSLISILTIGYIGYSNGKDALTKNVFNQLIGLRSAKVTEIESYFKLNENEVLALSETPAIQQAIRQFKAAFGKLSIQHLSAQQQQKIESFYEKYFIPRLQDKVEGTPRAETYVPRTAAQEYLQYYYIANNPYVFSHRSTFGAKQLDNAGDGSKYSQVHATFHPYLKGVVERFGFEDLLLVDAKTGDVIYSTKKDVDLGTNLRLGPYTNTKLAQGFEAVVKSGDPNFVTAIDFELYRPDFLKPAAFIATTVYDGSDFIGALILQIPTDEIDRIVNANDQWQRVGLEQTGALVLTGPDHLLRSTPRFFIEDREKYLKALSDNASISKDQIERIRRVGTPIMVKDSHTVPVEEALEGKEGTATYRSYRGAPILAAYEPVKLGDFNWALVGAMDVSEAFAPINQLRRRLLIAAAILVPLVTLLSNWLSRLFVRPIKQLIAGTRKIEAGETDVEVQVQSQDEFGELAQSFNQMAHSLHDKEQLIQEKMQENERLLLNILPAPIAKRLKDGEQQIADVFPSITVLYAEIEGFNELSAQLSPAEGAIALLNELVGAFDEAAEPYDVEKVKTLGGTYLAACGLSVQRVDHAKRMMDFAFEMLKIVRRFNQQRETNLGLDIGIHSGPVVAGIVGKTKFIYDLMGDTMNIARAIHTSQEQNVVQVTQSVYDSLHDLYKFERVGDLELKEMGKLPVWSTRTGVAESPISRSAVVGMEG